MDAHNPLVPAAYDLAWSGLAAVALVLTVVALVSLARRARTLGGGQALVWVLIVLFVPLLGSVSWLAVGRRARHAAGLEQSS